MKQGTRQALLWCYMTVLCALGTVAFLTLLFAGMVLASTHGIWPALACTGGGFLLLFGALVTAVRSVPM